MPLSTHPCKCGCGQDVRGKRAFVNKEHQLNWMSAGGARELNEKMPYEARVRGGEVAGKIAAESGRLPEASKKGAQKAQEIARSLKRK